MPVMLVDPDTWSAWLDLAVDAASARELLVPLDADRMFVRTANPVVNSARHEGAECLGALAA